MSTFRVPSVDDQLVDDIAPVIDGILGQARRGSVLLRESFDDVRAEVFARVIEKLRGASEGTVPVAHLGDYVATVTRNCIHDLLRAHRPQRARLKNRLRFLLSNDRRFATWNIDGVVLCGLMAWRGSSGRGEEAMARGPMPLAACDAPHPAEALLALFEAAGAPLELDGVVEELMDRWNIVEETAVDITTIAVEDERPTQLASLETRSYLQALWSEIAALPPSQRTALLLNLRDHRNGNALPLFVLLGIADFDSVAETVGITAGQLADLWCDLPLDDATIAARLDMTRQQVINVRKSARERLRRRLNR